MRKVRLRVFPVSQLLSRKPGFRPKPLRPALRRRKEGRAGEELKPVKRRGCLVGGDCGDDPGKGEKLEWRIIK